MILELTRPLFYLDSETTGLTQDARILELGFEEWGPEGLVREWRTYIDPIVPIPKETTAIHGISGDMFTNCRVCGQPLHGHVADSLFSDECTTPVRWPKFKDIAPELAADFSNCDFAGKNIRFDLRKLAEEFQRCGLAWSYAGARVIDAERLEQIAVPRRLADLYRKYTSEELEGAHGALTDAKASRVVIEAQLVNYSVLPRSLDALHELQWPGWLSSDGSFKRVNGVPTCMLKKHRDTPMNLVPKSYYDWILSADFPSDVKELAAAAKMGQFPETQVITPRNDEE